MTGQRDELPAEVLSFIHQRIDSVEQLQILLLLVQDPCAQWTIERISRELRSSSASVQKRIGDLCARKVLAPEAVSDTGEIRFLAFDADVDQLVRELSGIFRHRPHRVIAQIFAKPSPSLRSFADAFKLKKDDPS